MLESVLVQTIPGCVEFRESLKIMVPPPATGVESLGVLVLSAVWRISGVEVPWCIWDIERPF
ncbi:MAG: hypothetical protein ACLTLQ_03415 [[Clostridium] scindens]